MVALGIRHHQQDTADEVLADLYCIRTHPRDADPPCSRIEPYPAALPVVLVSFMFSLSIVFSVIAFLSFRATWVWWWRLVCGRYIPIRELQRERANTTKSSGTGVSKEKLDDKY